MPTLEALLIFTGAALALNLSPGPSNFYVMSRSISQGALAGAVASAGLAAGGLVHVVAATIGVAALLQHVPVAFTVLKLCGAAYLVFLGIRHFMALRQGTARLERAAARPRMRIFLESALVEVLNPKTALFFLALLPQFVDPAAGPVAPQMLLLGLIVTVTAIPCDLAVAFASGKAARLIGGSGWLMRAQHALSGTILVGLGVFVALARRPAP
jgi:threonine/homoserine/homoserine lactone efflux protein